MTASTKHVTSSLLMPATRLVATDMDSTIGLFWAYFVPAMNYISPILSARLNVSQVEFEREVGRVMHLRRSHEWPWIMEETKFRRHWTGSAKSFRREISEPFWAALDEMRHAYLRPFADVLSTIDEARALGTRFAIVSDAPLYMALTRAIAHGIDGRIEALYALSVKLPDVSEFVDPSDMELGLERIRAMEGAAHCFNYVRKLPLRLEKPHPGGLEMAMQDFCVDPSQTLFIGDSLVKDGGVAAACGVRYIWAQYGTYLPTEYLDLVDRRFTPSGAAATNGHGVSFRPLQMPPMVARAASYSDLLSYLNNDSQCPHCHSQLIRQSSFDWE